MGRAEGEACGISWEQCQNLLEDGAKSWKPLSKPLILNSSAAAGRRSTDFRQFCGLSRSQNCHNFRSQNGTNSCNIYTSNNYRKYTCSSKNS
jgi:hypothetical protein